MRYIVGFLIGIGLLVLTVILVIRIFSGGGAEDAPRPIDLNSYSTTDTVVRLTLDGPVVANQQHEQLRITVGRDAVLYERFQGYQGDIVDTRSYPNNQDAYAEFLRALDVAEFEKGNADGPKDERGFCPTGQRYIYEAIGEGENLVRWWNTSCGGNTGNFVGRGSVVRNLFKKQVPDYNELTRRSIF